MLTILLSDFALLLVEVEVGWSFRKKSAILKMTGHIPNEHVELLRSWNYCILVIQKSLSNISLDFYLTWHL